MMKHLAPFFGSYLFEPTSNLLDDIEENSVSNSEVLACGNLQWFKFAAPQYRVWWSSRWHKVVNTTRFPRTSVLFSSPMSLRISSAFASAATGRKWRKPRVCSTTTSLRCARVLPFVWWRENKFRARVCSCGSTYFLVETVSKSECINKTNEYQKMMQPFYDRCANNLLSQVSEAAHSCRSSFQICFSLLCSQNQLKS